jgi:cytochrome c oxidase cbb3-type subunit 2
MNSGPMLFLGLFATMACTWTGFVLGPQLQLGGLAQTNTVVVGKDLSETYPVAQPGEAHAGAEIYRANGCAACHTQMVRPGDSPGDVDLGSDIQRRWGKRRSTAEDYLFEQPVMLGSQRVGPDLANFGRLVDTNSNNGIYLRLYDPQLVTAHSVMPPYRFLFETRKIGLFPSTNALVLPDQDAPPAGYEIVPRPEARALAAYLANLRQDAYLYDAPPPAWMLPKTNAAPTNAVATNAAPAAAKPPSK